MISKRARICSNVRLGINVTIDDFVLIGITPGGDIGDLSCDVGEGAIIRAHTVIYAGTVLGRRVQTGHGVLIREQTTLGDDVSIGSHSVIEHHVRIADRVRIHSQVFVPEFSVLEEGAWLGPNVVLTNAMFPLGYGIKNRLEGPRIGAGAILCANCTILPGVRVGRQALVGAGAVVVEDVPDGTVVVGNPAHAIKQVADLRYPDGTSPYSPLT